MSNNVLDSCCQMEIPYEFLDVRNHPTPKDLEQNMSKELVEVYLKTCTPIERTLFGRDKPLKGPNNLWIHPDDRSDCCELRLTSVKTEAVQALTHQGILKIGQEMEEKINEKTKRLIEKAVADTEEFVRFEADQQIRFHVKNETENVNEKWQELVKQLMMKHEVEEHCIRQFYLESRELLREFVMERFEKELASKTTTEAKTEMDKKCSEQVDAEIIRQSNLFQEQMENTLRNLVINDRDRMEEMRKQCLNAMEVQSHLMWCRQITEMIHLMAVDKKHRGKGKLADLEKDGERLKKSQQDQSKSVKNLLTEFMQQLDGLDVATLDSSEEKIYSEIHQYCRKFLIEQRHQEFDELLIIQEPERTETEMMKDESNQDWIETRYIHKNIHKQSPFVNVNWEKIVIDNSRVHAEDEDGSFVSSVFNRFTQPHNSIHVNASTDVPQIVSSIINMVQKSKSNDEQLHENIETMIHDVIMKKLSSVDPPAVDIVPMPKTETLTIKDSLEACEKLVSIQTNSRVESHQGHLLGAVNSLELINNSTSRVVTRKSSIDRIFDEALNASDSSEGSAFVPSHKKSSKNSNCGLLYKKMTKEDWVMLKEDEVSNRQAKSRRASSVQFDDDTYRRPVSGSLERTSRRSSILKERSVQTGHNIDQSQDALHPIREKCREALKSMKLESILLMLCDD